jgi:hypothetical protein
MADFLQNSKDENATTLTGFPAKYSAIRRKVGVSQFHHIRQVMYAHHLYQCLSRSQNSIHLPFSYGIVESIMAADGAKGEVSIAAAHSQQALLSDYRLSLTLV